MEPPRHLLATLRRYPSHRLSEEEISLLWKFVLPRFHRDPPLKTHTDRTVFINDPGSIGHCEGPDVQNASILIDETVKTGDVEIHHNPSDWYHHGHHRDPAYNEVVLHVCMKGKEPPTRREDGTFVETISLNDRLTDCLDQIETAWGKNVEQRLASVKRPCYRAGSHSLKSFHRELLTVGEGWLGHRAGQLRERPRPRRLWEAMIGSLGYVRNHDTFRTLARGLSRTRFYQIIKESSRLERESWLLGVAGCFESLDQRSVNRTIRRRYQCWRTQFSAESARIRCHDWNHSGVRPNAFPVRRWVYFGLASSRLRFTWSEWFDQNLHPMLFQPSFRAPARRTLRSLFQKNRGYWKYHYTVRDNRHDSLPIPLGPGWIDQCFINVIFPWYYLRGLERGGDLSDRVIYHLRNYPPVMTNRRNRRLVSQWGQSERWTWENALEQQGGTFLYKFGCRENKCEQCLFNQKKTGEQYKLFSNPR